MNDDDISKAILERFELKCKKCNSIDIELCISEPIEYGGETGRQSGSIIIQCRSCNDNEFYLSI